MKRKITAITLAALVTVGLSACGQTLADVKKDATFAHSCKAAGGHVYYDDGIRCDFS